MSRTACTEHQCLHKDGLYLYLYETNLLDGSNCIGMCAEAARCSRVVPCKRKDWKIGIRTDRLAKVIFFCSYAQEPKSTIATRTPCILLVPSTDTHLQTATLQHTPPAFKLQHCTVCLPRVLTCFLRLQQTSVTWMYFLHTFVFLMEALFVHFKVEIQFIYIT